MKGLSCLFAISGVVALACVAAPCMAQEQQSIGLAADVGVASAYYFRGFNVFQQDKQMDQHFLLAPSLTYTLPGTNAQIGYWGAFQLNGDNASAKVDAGLGAEQDLFVTYSHALAEGLTLSGTLTAYYYPLADEAVAGTNHPLYLEPQVGLTWSQMVDVSLKVAYMHGVQEALEVGRYTYLTPSVAKTLAVTESLSLAASGWLGYKLFTEDGIEDNVWDAGVSVALPISLPHAIYVRPSLSLIWTNFKAKELADELGFCGAVNVGIAL